MEGQVFSTRNESCFYRDKQGIKGHASFPCTPNPRRTDPSAPLRTLSVDEAEHFRHNHLASVASLRRCSPSLRNAVRLPSGIGVHLHRNTHAFRITVDIETSTPPISSLMVIHLSAPDSAILDDSSATRRLLSKNGHLGSLGPDHAAEKSGTRIRDCARG